MDLLQGFGVIAPWIHKFKNTTEGSHSVWIWIGFQLNAQCYNAKVETERLSCHALNLVMTIQIIASS